MEKFFASMKRIFKARNGNLEDTTPATEELFDAMAQQQREFQERKQRVEEDIKRGAKYTRTKLPL